jgi:NADPH-dependent curcumin reductase CurA
MTITNKQIVLSQRPSGEVKETDFKLIESPVPKLKDGEVLLKTQYFSLDPYMRSRMNDIDSYIGPNKLNEVLEGAAICIIEDSKNPNFKVGDLFLTFTGWQEYTVVTPNLIKGMAFNPVSVTKLDPDIKPSLYLGALGMPGFTAYHGLLEIGQPKKGETVVVAAATGPVGSMVGQLAKARGCYAVGIAGGSEKCRYAVEHLGFDACVDHKSKTMAQDLKKACPKGIDIYYENVGGPVFSAVLPLLNEFSRVPVCGAVHWYNDGVTLGEKSFSPSQIIPRVAAFSHMLLHLDQTPLIWLAMIGKRIKFQGFIISDNFDDYPQFLKETIPLIKSGKIIAKEDIIKGIENAPQAFAGLLRGKNFGKLVIEI